MPSGYYRGFDERDYLLQGSPSATFAENFPHDQITTDLVASLTTAVMTSVAMPLIAGDIITRMSVLSGATALATPTHDMRIPRNRAVIMLVIDMSQSMRATDVEPNRLKAAEQAAGQFAGQLTPGINLGLIALLIIRKLRSRRSE